MDVFALRCCCSLYRHQLIPSSFTFKSIRMSTIQQWRRRPFHSSTSVNGVAQHPRDVLGVANDASLVEIKARYLELVKRFHPDNKATGDNLRFIEIQSAYNHLRKVGGLDLHGRHHHHHHHVHMKDTYGAQDYVHINPRNRYGGNVNDKYDYKTSWTAEESRRAAYERVYKRKASTENFDYMGRDWATETTPMADLPFLVAVGSGSLLFMWILTLKWADMISAHYVNHATHYQRKNRKSFFRGDEHITPALILCSGLVIAGGLAANLVYAIIEHELFFAELLRESFNDPKDNWVKYSYEFFIKLKQRLVNRTYILSDSTILPTVLDDVKIQNDEMSRRLAVLRDSNDNNI